MLIIALPIVPEVFGPWQHHVTAILVVWAFAYSFYNWNATQLIKVTQITTTFIKSLQKLLREWLKLRDAWRKR